MTRFSVDNIVVTELGFEAQGRVHEGNVSLGTIFKALAEDNVRSTGKTPVALIVKRILCYRRSIDKLPHGMTGQLWLEGDGAERLAEIALPAILISDDA